jgi:hypothetical protein
MKTNRICRILAICLAGSVIAPFATRAAPDDSTEGMRDASVHAQLVEIQRSAQDNDPMAALDQAPARESSEGNEGIEPRDFIAASDVLSSLGMATLVPKRAVIYVPKRLEDRLKLQADAQFRTFPEFARFNRAWLRTLEVTQAQAEGIEKIDEKSLEREKRLGQVIVATFHGGPISVLPPKEAANESR